jgi:hypothetical protein
MKLKKWCKVQRSRRLRRELRRTPDGPTKVGRRYLRANWGDGTLKGSMREIHPSSDAGLESL